MRQLLVALLIGLQAPSICAKEESSSSVPLVDGRYRFTHKYAEHPSMKSITLEGVVKGNHIVLINNDSFDVFPKGVIEEGTLMWHAKSRQWIIGHTPDDARTEEVGGCSDGPSVIDLKKRVYWTC